MTRGTRRCLRQVFLARSIATGGRDAPPGMHNNTPSKTGPYYRSIIHSHARDRSTPATDTDTGLSARPSPNSPAALKGTKEGGVQTQQWQDHGGVPGAFRGNTRVLRFENGAPDSLRARAPRTEITRGVTARMGTAARSGGGSHHRRCPRAQGIFGGLRRER